MSYSLTNTLSAAFSTFWSGTASIRVAAQEKLHRLWNFISYKGNFAHSAASLAGRVQLEPFVPNGTLEELDERLILETRLIASNLGKYKSYYNPYLGQRSEMDVLRRYIEKNPQGAIKLTELELSSPITIEDLIWILKTFPKLTSLGLNCSMITSDLDVEGDPGILVLANAEYKQKLTALKLSHCTPTMAILLMEKLAINNKSEHLKSLALSDCELTKTFLEKLGELTVENTMFHVIEIKKAGYPNLKSLELSNYGPHLTKTEISLFANKHQIKTYS